MKEVLALPEGLFEGEQFFQSEYGIVAGIDEAGRGPLSGPVVAAAAILPKGLEIPGLNDSKKLTEKKREALFPIVKELALDWAIASASPSEIDEINILNATFLAMRRALEALKTPFSHSLVDGSHKIREWTAAQTPVVKGDGRVLSIAAASILAKVERDHIMESLHLEYPEYNWAKNKGYPSKEHQGAIVENGWTQYHRKSFHVKALAEFDIIDRKKTEQSLGCVLARKNND